jgi:hypothetical protein
VCVVEMQTMAPMAHNYGTKVEPCLGGINNLVLAGLISCC